MIWSNVSLLRCRTRPRCLGREELRPGKGTVRSLRVSRPPEARAVVFEHLFEEISSSTRVVRPMFLLWFDRGIIVLPGAEPGSYAIWPARRDRRAHEEATI